MPTANFFSRVTRHTRLGRECSWVLVGQAGAGLGAIAGVKLLTHAMTPADYGDFSLALTATILVQQCLGGPLGQAAMRFYSASKEGGWTFDYLRGLNRLMLKGLAMLAAVGLLAAAGCGLTGHSGAAPGVALAILLAAVTAYNIVCDSIQSGSRNRPVVALHQVAIQWLRPLGALALFALLSASFGSAVFGYVAATMIVLGSQIAFLARQVRAAQSAAPNSIANAQQKLFDYAWPFASWGLLAWAQLASDRWFLELFRGAPSVAAYTVCYQLGYYPVLLLATAVSNLASPIIFEIAGAGTDRARLDAAWRANRLHVRALVALTLGATGALAALHGPLFRLLTTAAYAPYSRYVPILAASAGVFAVAQAASLVFLITARSSELTATKCVPAAAGLFLNMAGAYWFGVPGAAMATLLFSLIYLAAIVRLIRNAQSCQGAMAIFAWPRNQVVEG